MPFSVICGALQALQAVRHNVPAHISAEGVTPAFVCTKPQAMDHMPNSAHEDDTRALEVITPSEQTVPLVFASPHSGRRYGADFMAASVLDMATLRKSEDAFVDELFAAAPAHGAPLISALFPRAFVDPNREPYELDQTMFTDPLPDYANTRSPRVAAGLGTIARVVATGANIYASKLSFAEAERRISTCYLPYHGRLQSLVDATCQRFGCCLLVDCHSMPSMGRQSEGGGGGSEVADIVLGDCYGSSCAGIVSDTAETLLEQQGYRVVRNTPYAGGFTTRHYGRPRSGVHALQIEINRRLYMDEACYERSPAFGRVAQHMDALIGTLAAIPRDELLPP